MQPGTTMYRFAEYTTGQYMTQEVITVARSTTLRELEQLFERHDFNAFPVVEAGTMLGLVTKLDFLKAFIFTTGQIVPHYDELMQKVVSDVMTEAVVHLDATTPLTRALQMMVDLKARSFPVIGPDRQLAGMISREDVMRALRDATGAERSPSR